jgi:hypothetical protein
MRAVLVSLVQYAAATAAVAMQCKRLRHASWPAMAHDIMS